MWSPPSSTLITGERDAILVGTTITYDQVDRLADWVERFGKQVVGVVITHGHSDHWIGLARLQERFPHARGLATRDVLARARFEATDEGMRAYWRGLFPGEIPDVPVQAELFDGDSIDLDGHQLRVIDIGQGDIEHSTIVHLPSLRAVAAADVVYNKVHTLTALTDATAREAWIASIGSIAALDPDIVVAGPQAGRRPGLATPSSRASGTCVTSRASPPGATPPSRSSPRCWNCTATGTTRTRCGPPRKPPYDAIRGSRAVLGTNWRCPGIAHGLAGESPDLDAGR